VRAGEYVVPAALRGAMFVPWQAPGRRAPARVSAGAFQAAGLPVPEHAGQRNIYQLTRRQGLPWSPGLDAQIRRRGGELLGHGDLVLVDIDCPAAVDGRPLVDAVRWLADRAVEGGGLLDLSGTVIIATLVNALSHHGLAADSSAAAEHVAAVLDAPGLVPESEQWLRRQIDRTTAELQSLSKTAVRYFCVTCQNYSGCVSFSCRRQRVRRRTGFWGCERGRPG